MICTHTRAHLYNLAGSLGITERVRFLGLANQTQWPAVHPGAEVLVLPSAFEPFVLVVDEAFAYGTPAIASPGGCDDLIREGQRSVPFPPGDVAALADPKPHARRGGARSDGGRGL